MPIRPDVSRREFLGTTAAAGTALVAGGVQPAPAAEVPAKGRDDMAYYFGYGSNLHVENTLTDLLPNGRFLMRAYLPNYQVQFRWWSNNLRGGISNIMEVPGEMVEAALYECPQSDLDTLDYRLDYYVPDYKREVFRVQGEDGEWYQASLYRLWEPKGPFPPARGYMEGMLEGARQLGLSQPYIERLEGFLQASIVAPD